MYILRTKSYHLHQTLAKIRFNAGSTHTPRKYQGDAATIAGKLYNVV
jgi:hypothetical protein